MKITKTIANQFYGFPVLDVKDGQIVDVIYIKLLTHFS